MKAKHYEFIEEEDEEEPIHRNEVSYFFFDY